MISFSANYILHTKLYVSSNFFIFYYYFKELRSFYLILFLNRSCAINIYTHIGTELRIFVCDCWWYVCCALRVNSTTAESRLVELRPISRLGASRCAPHLMYFVFIK